MKIEDQMSTCFRCPNLVRTSGPALCPTCQAAQDMRDHLARIYASLQDCAGALQEIQASVSTSQPMSLEPEIRAIQQRIDEGRTAIETTLNRRTP